MNKTRILYNDSYALLGLFKLCPVVLMFAVLYLGFDNATLSSQFILYDPFTMCFKKLQFKRALLLQ